MRSRHVCKCDKLVMVRTCGTGVNACADARAYAEYEPRRVSEYGHTRRGYMQKQDKYLDKGARNFSNEDSKQILVRPQNKKKSIRARTIIRRKTPIIIIEEIRESTGFR